MLIRHNSLTGFKNNTERFNNFRKLGNTPSDIEVIPILKTFHGEEIKINFWEGR